MSDPKFIRRIKPLLVQGSLFVIVLMWAVGCSKMDEQTQAKIDYWKQQASMMTLLGPQKEEVFAWVFAIDPHARYSGENLTATLEKIDRASSADKPLCITLSIDFDERERVKKHKVWLDKSCS